MSEKHENGKLSSRVFSLKTAIKFGSLQCTRRSWDCGEVKQFGRELGDLGLNPLSGIIKGRRNGSIFHPPAPTQIEIGSNSTI